MKRLHLFVLFFHSYFVYATPATKINPYEMRPIGSDQINPAWSINKEVSMVPPIRPPSSDGWSPIIQAMRATIEEQTNEINRLKLRMSLIENKLKEDGK